MSSYQLRPYQKEAVDAIFEAWKEHQSTLVVMPTGVGKSVLFSEVLKRTQTWGRGMVLAHRGELIHQAAEHIERATGIHPDIEMAEYVANESSWGQAPVIVSSIQTQCAGKNGGRMQKFDPNDFAIIVVDEAHHATADTYVRVIDYYKQNPRVKILGVTATPDRADEEALGQVFEYCAYDYELPDAIRDGWLVPIEASAVHVEGLDYSLIRTTAGDLNGKDLAAVLEDEEPLHEMAQATVEAAMGLKPHALDPVADLARDDIGLFHAEMKTWLESNPPAKTLIFTASVEHARLFSLVLNRWIPNSAEWVCGKTNKDDRRVMFERYANDNFPFLCNVGVATEGFDEPNIKLVVMARPTKSRGLYSQMTGRGTRPCRLIAVALNECFDALARRAMIMASEKPILKLLDFVGNAGRHKLVSAADILGGNYPDEVIVRAGEMMRETEEPKKPEEILEEALEQIKIEAEQAANEDARKKAKLLIKSVYKTVRIKNLFDRISVEPQRERAWHKGRRPTDKMQAYLERKGMWDKNLTYTQASVLIQGLVDRQSNGVCTPNQGKILERFGYSKEMTFKQASRTIDAIKLNDWKRPEEAIA